VLFVIEFDGEQHFSDNQFYNFKNSHINDIIKQYYLEEMNIHLLRISDVDDIE
jgi:hypothetical protein